MLRSWSGYGDELAWAALWLYKATKDSSYLDKAKNLYNEFNLGSWADQFAWDNKKPGVFVSYCEN